MKKVFVVFSLFICVSFVWAYKKHSKLEVPHAPHSKVQYHIEEFVFSQHGPDVECKRKCAPEGFEDEIETDLEVVTCGGHKDDAVSCAKLGSQCGKTHRSGCAEYCRSQCCACCSV